MPTEYPKIRGKTQAEKNASIEHALRSIARRATKRAVVYVPPVPLLFHKEGVAEGNTLGRILLPFSGTLKDLYVRVGELNTRTATLSLEIGTDIAKTQMHFTLSSRAQRLEVELEVDAGTLLQLALVEGSLTDCLIATAIYPNLSEHESRSLLLEGIEEDEPTRHAD